MAASTMVNDTGHRFVHQIWYMFFLFLNICKLLLFFRPSTGIPVLHSGSHFRHGLLQLMIHTIDPLHDGNFDFKYRINDI